MLFWILFWLPVWLFVAYIVILVISQDSDFASGGFMVWLFASAICVAIVGDSWSKQASDLGTIVAQDQVSAVYQQQITSLQAELTGFHYQPGALLNKDTPVAAVVEALTNVQGQLTEAQVKKAQAVVSIEKRRKGPMSGVIHWVGDYK